MTLVSTKYTRDLSRVINARKVCILANVGHAHKDFRKALPLRPAQRLGQDFTMLGFSATAVSCCHFTQSLHESLIDISNQKICHCHSFTLRYQ
ncbi:hypothetical protein AWV80_00200 [Cupriavidus sp. UYMU48A]|nr:hypothetical protein AWV80_00200 [Cupriavidus sp. UYMU48A]